MPVVFVLLVLLMLLHCCLDLTTECDVVVTRDLQLICRHEPNLNSTTDAWQRFPDRAATYTIDGEVVSGIFAADLTLAEIKQLRAKQRWASRDHSHDGAFAIATLGEFLDVVLSAPRAVGIYPEVKHPSWHNALPQLLAAGTTIEQLIVEALHAHGYAASTTVNSDAWRAQPVFIQSFEPTSLRRLAGMTRMPLVLLMGGWEGYVAPDTGMTHDEMVSDEFLSELAGYVAGVGPWKSSLYAVVGCDESASGVDMKSGSNDSSTGSSGAGVAAAVAVAAPCRSIHCSNFIHPDVGRQVEAPGSSSSSSSEVVVGKVRMQSNGLVGKLHGYGFAVHPYTLRDEAQFVPEGCAGDISCEFAWLFDSEGVDGGFADWPGTLHDWLQQRRTADA
jgi:glycerophosphoryl diester phosphodiesterase